MKRICLLLSALGLIISCNTLPQVYPTGGSVQPPRHDACRHPFASGKWQFLHAIEATMPGGRKGFLMGITVISSVYKSVHCVIMTIEGLVVFDAKYDQKIVVNRSVPPFDSEDFARGLIEDIRLIFFMPDGLLIKSGFLKNGSFVCRYRNPDERIVDIISYEDKTWEIRQYSNDLRLVRIVKGIPNKNEGPTSHQRIPGRIELTAYGSLEYVLVMNLVEAIPLMH